MLRAHGMLNFRRITTQKKFIPQIDGLRFVAIASVVLFHLYSALEGRGATRVPIPSDHDLPKPGVELFFAISGFILGVPFASHYILSAPKVRLKQYFLRRLTRLEPPYFLSFPLWMALQWVAAGRSFSDMLPHLLSHAVYIYNFIYSAFPGAVNTVMIVVLYLAAFRGRICSALFSHSLITDIGGMCYSIYLLHFPIIYAVKHITAFWHIGSNFWVYCTLQAVLILPCVLLVCGAFFLLIERPCMDREWPKKLWNHFHALLAPRAEQPQS